jgi:PAS domain-containing protein
MGGIVASSSTFGQEEIFLQSFKTVNLLSGQNEMKADVKTAQSFTEYVKGGTWVNRFANFSLSSNGRQQSPRAVNWRTTYGVPAGVFPSSFQPVHSTQTDPLSECSRDVSTAVSAASTFAESYGAAEGCHCFTRTQLACVLFAILYETYKVSTCHHRKPSVGSFWSRSQDETSYAGGAQTRALVQTPQSLRTQELLLGCAAYHDAEQLLHLVQCDWLSVVARAVEEHPLPISILDTSRPNGRFRYVNAAMCAQCGCHPSDLMGKPISFLRGEATEECQSTALQRALHGSTHAKLWITHYTKTRQRVLDLVAVAPLGSVAVCVHFAAREGANFSLLEVRRSLASACRPSLTRRFCVLCSKWTIYCSYWATWWAPGRGPPRRTRWPLRCFPSACSPLPRAPGAITALQRGIGSSVVGSPVSAASTARTAQIAAAAQALVRGNSYTLCCPAWARAGKVFPGDNPFAWRLNYKKISI